MNAAVVDASALLAVMFEEPQAEPIRAFVGGHLIAPTLLRYEVANALTMKLLTNAEATARFQAWHEVVDALDIEYAEPDWRGLPLLARRWALTAYDAAYLQVALARRAPLITLDARLAAAYEMATA